MALISINTTDYFALASRSNSYLYVAVSVARYKEYLYPFAEELLHNKITHWVLCSLQFFFMVQVIMHFIVANFYNFSHLYRNETT
jgi:hypothetical protein